jgi:N-acetylmuramoyl-L-alanine amidase
MRRLPAILLMALLGACASGPKGVNFDDSLSAKSQDSRVQFLVLHFTAENLAESIRILAHGGVSSHYLVTDETPVRTYRLVDESRRAWHAGLSHWRGHAMLNAASIGIEIVNPGKVKTADGERWVPFTPAQEDAVVALVQDIVRRHQIKPEFVIGHSDIAPMRRVDPGPLFPWRRLAELGLIVWPDAGLVAAQTQVYAQALPDVAWFQTALARHGFQLPRHGELDQETRTVLAAFQMKYRPSNFDGQPDAETAAMLHVLTQPAAKP